MSVQVAAQDVLARFAALGAGQQRSPEAVALVINSGLSHLSKPELDDALELLEGATTGLSMMTDQERQGMQAGLQILRPPPGAGNAALGFQVAQSGLQDESASAADVDLWAQITAQISSLQSQSGNEGPSGFRALYRGLTAMKHGYRGAAIESSALRQQIDNSVLDIVNEIVGALVQSGQQPDSSATVGAQAAAEKLDRALRADPSTFLITTSRAVSIHGKRFFDHAHRWAQGTTPGARQLRRTLKEHRTDSARASEAAWTTPASKLSAARRAKLIGFERSSITPLQVDVLKNHVEQAATSGDGAFAFRLAFAVRAALDGIEEAGVESFSAWSQDKLTQLRGEMIQLCSEHIDAGVAAFREVMLAWVEEDPKSFLREADNFSRLAFRWTASLNMNSPSLDFSALIDQAREVLELKALDKHLGDLDRLSARFDTVDVQGGLWASDLIRDAGEQMAKRFTKVGPHAAALASKRNALTAKVAGALIARERQTFENQKDSRTGPEDALFFLATDRLDAWIAGGGKSEVEPWAGHLRKAAFDTKSESPAAQKVWGELNQLRAASREHGWSMSPVGYKSTSGPRQDSAAQGLSRVTLGEYPRVEDFAAALEDAKDRGQTGHPIQAFRIAERVALELPSNVSYPRDSQPASSDEPTLAQRGLSQQAVSDLQTTARSIMLAHGQAAVLGEAELAEACVAGSYLATHYLAGMISRATHDPDLNSTVVGKLQARRERVIGKRKLHDIAVHKKHLATQSERIAKLDSLDKVTVDTVAQVSEFVSTHETLRFAGRGPDESEAPTPSKAQVLLTTMPPIATRLQKSAGETAVAVRKEAQAKPATVQGFTEALKLTSSIRMLRLFQRIGDDTESADFDRSLHAVGTTLLERAQGLLDAGEIDKTDAVMSNFRSLVPYDAKGPALVALREKIEAVFSQD